jgi:sigma-E factor negative regulatory protein RseB
MSGVRAGVLRTGLRWAPVLALAVLASPFLTGSSSAAQSEVVPGSDPAALALLRAAVRAESTLTYGGLEDVTGEDASDGGSDDTSSTRSADTAAGEVVAVSHVAGQGTVLMLSAVGTASGTRAGFLGAGARRPDLLVDLLQRCYRVVLDGTATVAGRPTRVVAVQDVEGQVAARFWVDDATGLLLRRDLVDRSGRTTASSAFRAVSLTGAPVSFLPPLLPTASTGGLDSASLQSYRSNGWPVPAALGGLALFDARQVPGDGTGDGGVLHLTYSDGLSTASVFVQRGRLDVADLPGARHAVLGGQHVLVLAGHPRQVVWDADGFVITVVADTDRDQLGGVVADLPHGQQDVSGWGRVERGLSRMVSWVNPFD